MADSTLRIPSYAGFCNPSELPKGPNGRALCRWCKTEVPPGKRTFCSQGCIDEHRIRTQPAFAKARVYERDHGVCALCGLDTAASIKGPSVRFSRWPSATANSFWDLDHIVPVVEGGGACGLENYRTLCKPCHKGETAALAKRRAERRRAEKETANAK